MQSLSEASRGVGRWLIPLRARVSSHLEGTKGPMTLSLLAFLSTTKHKADERRYTAGTMGTCDPTAMVKTQPYRTSRGNLGSLVWLAPDSWPSSLAAHQ
jgi:hypothetical protein